MEHTRGSEPRAEAKQRTLATGSSPTSTRCLNRSLRPCQSRLRVWENDGGDKGATDMEITWSVCVNQCTKAVALTCCHWIVGSLVVSHCGHCKNKEDNLHASFSIVEHVYNRKGSSCREVSCSSRSEHILICCKATAASEGGPQGSALACNA